jgi:hypothetical protein
MAVVNIPVYYNMATIKTVKSFIVQAVGQNTDSHLEPIQGTLSEGEGSVRLTSL